MAHTLAVICVILMVLCLLLIIMGLPGIWIILGITGLWAFFSDSAIFNWQFFLLLIAMAIGAEIAEFYTGFYGTKKFGGSKKGGTAGMIGAIVGGILCAPILFGLGALPGALAGGFLACFTVEKMAGVPSKEAMKAALGTTLGRFGGFLIKIGIGIWILWLAIPRIWASIAANSM